MTPRNTLARAAAIILTGCTVTTTTSSGTTTRTYNPFASASAAADGGAPEGTAADGVAAPKGDLPTQVQAYCDQHDADTTWTRTTFAKTDDVHAEDTAAVDALCAAKDEARTRRENESHEHSRIDALFPKARLPHDQSQALFRRMQACSSKDFQETSQLESKGANRCDALRKEQASTAKSKGELEALLEEAATPPANPKRLADHQLHFPQSYDRHVVQQAFQQAAPARFVYPLVDLQGNRVGNNWGEYRPIPRGEALLLAEVNDTHALVVSVDGQRLFEVGVQYLSAGPVAGADPMPLRPDWIEVRGDDWRVRAGWYEIHEMDTFSDEGQPTFLKLADTSDPVVQKFITDLEAMRSCYDTQMAKLDPDHKRNHYDIETFDRNGNTKKVESMTSVLDRKVCATCKCTPFVAKQRTVVAHILKPAQDAIFDELKPTLAHVKSELKH